MTGRSPIEDMPAATVAGMSVRSMVVAVVAGVMFGVPLVVSPLGWQRYVALRWFVLALLVVVGVWAVGRETWERTPRSVRLAWIAVLTTTTLSIFVAPIRTAALLGDSGRRGGLSTTVLLLGAYLVGVAASGERARVLRAAPLATAIVVPAMVAGYGSTSLVVSSSVLVGNSGLLGGYLVVLLGCNVAVAAADADRRVRIAGLVGAAVCVPAIVQTGSHAAVLGAVASAIAAVATFGWRSMRGGARIAVAAGVPALLAAAVLWSAQFRVLGESARARADTWAVSVDVVLARPWLGWGPEGYRHGFASVVPPEFVARYADELVQDRAHSVVLDQAAATGLFGLAAFVWLVVAVARNLDRGDVGGRVVAAALVGVGVFLLGWFPAFDIAAVVAVLAGLATRPVPVGGHRPRRQRRAIDRTAVPRVTLLVACLAVVFVAGLVLRHDLRFATAMSETRAAAQGSADPVTLASSPWGGLGDLLAASAAVVAADEPATLAHARAAVATHRAGARAADAEWAIVAGQLAVAEARVTGDASLVLRGIDAFEQAIVLAPNHSVAWSRLGAAALLIEDRRARPALLRAAELRPEDVGPRFDLTAAALLRGDHPEARRWLRDACAIDRDDPQLEALAAQLTDPAGVPATCD